MGAGRHKRYLRRKAEGKFGVVRDPLPDNISIGETKNLSSVVQLMQERRRRKRE